MSEGEPQGRLQQEQRISWQGRTGAPRGARVRACTSGCVGSAVVPPRTIPNRVVKHRSADPTGGEPAGNLGPRTLTTKATASDSVRGGRFLLSGSL